MKIRNAFSAVLHRALGYSRSSRAESRPTGALGCTHRSHDMTARIVARYSAIERRWPALAMLLQQSDRSDVTTMSQSFHSTHPSIYLSPRVVLRLLVVKHPGQDRSSKQVAVAHLRGVPASHMALDAGSLSSARDNNEASVLNRITRRVVREERLSNIVVAQTSRRVTAAAAPPNANEVVRSSRVARVLRLSPKPVADTPAVAANAQAERQSAGVEPHRDKAPALQPPPVIDVARITDQVLQALDRRIVAQRERMGRN